MSIFSIISLLPFFCAAYCEALEGPISTRVGIILTTTLIQNRHIINKNCFTIYIYIYIYISLGMSMDQIDILEKRCRIVRP